MGNLAEKQCEACRTGAPKLSDEELRQCLKELPEWELVEDEGVKKLTRRYRTKNFREAMALADALAELAEAQGHHPVMRVEYGALTLWWWTHKIGGLHRNDAVMAAKSDEVHGQRRGG